MKTRDKNVPSMEMHQPKCPVVVSWHDSCRDFPVIIPNDKADPISMKLGHIMRYVDGHCHVHLVVVLRSEPHSCRPVGWW